MLHTCHRCIGIDRRHCNLVLRREDDCTSDHAVQRMDSLTACAHDLSVKVQSHYSPVNNGAACYAIVPSVSPSCYISLETNVVRHTIF